MSLLLIFWRKSVHYIAGLCRVLALLVGFSGAAGLLAQDAYEFSLLAGSGGASSSLDGDRTVAAYFSPYDVARDLTGNLYIADLGNRVIRKISSEGIVTTVAGSIGLTGSADGLGGAASFTYPYALTVDPSGNIFVADTLNHVIRRITPAGMVSTWAGSAGMSGSADGAGDSARFNSPIDICADGTGSLYVADYSNYVIRKISPTGVVTTVAGKAGTSGSLDGVGDNARFSSFQGLCLAPDGNLYVADTGSRTIRKVTPNGEVSTLAGLAGSAGTVDGSGAAARFTSPRAITSDSAGRLFVSDVGSGGYVVRRITPSGVVSTFAGSAVQAGFVDGIGSNARFLNPSGMVADVADNIYVADAGNHAIRKLAPDGTVTTFSGGYGAPGDVDGDAGDARFSSPRSLATGGSGEIYLADYQNRQIRVLTNLGHVTTLIEDMGPVWGVAVDSTGNSYASNAGALIYKITPAGVKSVFAGSTTGYADGQGAAAKFGSAYGLAVDRDGNVYVADRGNNVIRKITPDGQVGTLAGSPYYPDSAGFNDGTVKSARFNQPHAVAVDHKGILYVADRNNHTIRKITLDGRVSTLAGVAGETGAADGVGASARFNSPLGIAVDAHGYIYVADAGNGALRGISPEGVVTTLAGQGGYLTYQTGIGVDARFAGVSGVTVDAVGRVYVSDTSYNTILVGTNQTAPAITQQPSSQMVSETDRVVFSVLASGGYVNYQWRKNGVPIPQGNQRDLVIPAAVVGDAGSYDVVVSNLEGSVTSAPVSLVVSAIPAITEFSPSRLMITAGEPLSFSVSAAGTGVLHYQWQCNGVSIPGATSSSYHVASAGREDRGWYRVLVTDDNGTRRSPVSFVLVAPAITEVVAWGWDYHGQRSVPAGLGDVVAMSANGGRVLALRRDGTVRAWGYNFYGQSDVPDGLTDVVAVAAGVYHSLALKSDGTVVAWGLDQTGQTVIPTGLREVVSIAANGSRYMVLHSDGTVEQWGGSINDTVLMPTDLSDVVSVSVGDSHSLALRENGSLVAWGSAYSGTIPLPAGLSNVAAMSGGYNFSLVLKQDGTLAAWGNDENGQTAVPTGASDFVSVSAGYAHGLALRAEGTVVAWGQNYENQATVPVGLTDVWDIAAGGSLSVALRAATTDSVPAITGQPSGQIVAETGRLALSVTADGPGVLGYQWRKNGSDIPDATAATLVIEETKLSDAGDYTVVVYNHVGNATSAVAAVEVRPIPVVTLQTATRQVFAPGGAMDLTVTASGTGTLTYQWLHNGRFVAGATGSSLAVNSLTSRDGGWYVAVVTDANGTRYSQPMFVIVAPMRTQLIKWGPLVTLNVPEDVTDMVDFAAESKGILAVRRDGTVVWWGDEQSNHARIPAGITDAVAVATDPNYAMVLKSDGRVMVWGSVGAQGIPEPDWLEGLTDGVAISAGSSHGLMLRANGKVAGIGNYGPLYAGSTPPEGMDDFALITAGDRFSVAIRRNGAAVGWSSANQSAAVIPTGLTSISRLSGVSNYVMAANDSGVVSTWGSAYGFPITPPVGLSGVVDVAAEYDAAYALKDDGTVVAWGHNTRGQINVPAYANKVFRIGGYAALRDATADSTPVFSLQPDSQILTETQRLTLAATVTGAGPLTYQWRKNGEPIPGANSASFAIEELKLTDAGNYTLAVTNHMGTTISATAVVTINAIPVVTLPGPARHVVEPGEELHLEVAATGTGGMSYEWLHNGRTVQGVNGPSLDISNATMRDNGWYVAKVTDANGTRYGPPHFVLVAPALTQLRAWGATGDLVSALPVEVDDAVAVSAGSNHALAIRRDGTVVAWGNNYLNKATVPVGLTDVVAVASGNSQSVALKSDGSVVVWGQAGGFLGGITDAVAVAAGSAYGFALRSNGKVVSWSLSGTSSSEFPSGLGHVIALSSIDGHVLALTSDGNLTEWPRRFGTAPTGLGQMAAIVDGRNAVAVRRTDGTVTQFQSSGYSMTVPSGLADIVGLALGDYHTLALKADGSIVSWGSANSAVMTVPSDVTRAIAIAANGSFNLVLRDATQDVLPVITEQPVAQTLVETQRAVLGVVASGAAPLRYQWLKGSTPIAGATSATLNLENAQVADSGSYSVTVSNHVGSVTSLAVPLTVRPLPAIGLATLNRVRLSVGQPLSITATATGTGTLHYQWLHNGYLLSGATSASYSVPAVTESAAGWYALQVTDDYGTNTSAAVFVSLENTPGQIQHWGRWADPGSSATSSRLLSVDQPGLETAVQVGLFSPYTGLALLADGTLSSWGGVPYTLPTVTDAVSQALSVHGDLLLVLQSDGTVVTAGSGQFGQSIVPTGTAKVAAISSGDTFSLALHTNGTVSVWGNNTYGQCDMPAGLSEVVAISAGYAHSVVLKRDGTVAAWGYNFYGQTNVPAGLADVVAVAAGNNHSLALKRDGTVVGWGADDYGQSTAPGGLIDVMAIVAGSNRSMALREDGTVVAWGYNFYGESDVPAHLRDTGTSHVRFISAGRYTSMVIRDPAEDALPQITDDPIDLTVEEGLQAVFEVGATGVGPLSYQWRKGGVNVAGATSSTLVFASVVPGAAGDYDVIVTNATGSVTSSVATLTVLAKPVVTNIGATRQVLVPGANLTLSASATGTGSLSYQWIHNGRPLTGATAQTLTLNNLTAADGGWYALRVTDDNGTRVGAPQFVRVVPTVTQVVAWGRSLEGQVAVPAGLDDAIAVSAGQTHSLALRRDGTVVAWGNAYYGESIVPDGLDRVVGIWADEYRSYALRDDGTLVKWGAANPPTPTGLTNVVDLAVGGNHVLALKSDGTVVAWGGNNNYRENNVPAGLREVVAIAATDYLSLALRADGSIVTWGDINNWQPVKQVPTGLTAGTLQVRASFALAQKTDGTLAGWGSTAYGVDAVPAGLTNVTQLALGLQAAFALEADGTLIGWGSGTVATIPVDATKVLAISNYSNHALVLRDASADSAPQISTQPVTQTVTEGTMASLSVTIGVGNSLTYQWRHDGEPIAGATNATLTFASVTLADAGSYDVVVTNHVGSVTSNAAVLVINPLPTVSITGATRRMLVPGDNFSITATASGTGTVNYQWVHNGKDIAGATGATLNLANLAMTDSGWFAPKVTDANGTRFGASVFVAVMPAETELRAWGTEIISSPYTGILPIPTGLSDAVSITPSSYGGYALAVRRDGTVTMWGGVPTNDVRNLTDVVMLAEYSGRKLALKSDGTVVSPDITSYDVFESTLRGVVAVAVGQQAFYALKQDGTLVVWGGDAYGEITNVPDALSDVVSLSVYGTQVTAIQRNGSVVTWGNGATVPTGLTPVQKVSAGQSNRLFLQQDGTIKIDGYLGSGPPSLVVPVGLNSVVDVAMGNYHALALRADGAIVGWGRNDNTQATPPANLDRVLRIYAAGSLSLALRDATQDSVPVITSQPAGQTVTEGQAVTFSVAANGSPILRYQWKRNGLDIAGATGNTLTLGPVGPGNAGDYTVVVSNAAGSVQSVPAVLSVNPLPVVTLTSPMRTVRYPGDSLQLSASATGTGALSYQWYHNGRPVSGATSAGLNIAGVTRADAGWYVVDVTDVYGTRRSSAWFVLVVPQRTYLIGWGDTQNGKSLVPNGLNRPVAVSAGTDHSIALNADGTVVPWGASNFYSHTTKDATGIVAVAAGTFHTLALKSDGTVQSWGYDSLVPADLRDIVVIEAGGHHSVGLRSDGKVVSWDGANYLEVPSDAANVVGIAAGWQRSFAVKADGTVVDWGPSGYGWAPVPTGLTNVIAVAANSYHALALRADGTVVAWGSNGYGESTVPADLSDVVAISCGQHHSVAVKSDGNVVVWGRSDQLAVPASAIGVFQASGGTQYTLALADATLVSGPVITVQPQDKVVNRGQTVSFAVSGNASLPLSYRWRKNGIQMTDGANVSGTQTASLAIINAQDGDRGLYSVLVSNELGAIESNAARLAFNKLAQSISFATMADRSFVSVPITLEASTDSELSVAFSVVSGPATISGNQLTLTGTGTVTVRASQPGNENYLAATPVERSFTVTANGDSWAVEHFTSDELADANISGASADPDADGLTNLLEYALGLDPKSADTMGLPEAGSTATDWTYTYTRPADRDDLTYEVEVSTNLSSWTTVGVTLTPIGNDGDEETWQATYPLSSATNLFFRLKVTQD